jgi:hypothetical protein
LLARSIVEDVSVTLSLKRYFVNVVECSSGLLQQKENIKKKWIEKKTRGCIEVSSAVWLNLNTVFLTMV